MTAIELMNVEQAGPTAQAIFTDVKRSFGTIPNIYKMLAHSPEILETYHRHIKFFNDPEGTIDPVTRKMILLLVARLTNCQYLYSWFSLFLRQAGGTEVSMQAVSSDYRQAPIDDMTKAVLAYTEKITRSPLAISERERDRLADMGFSNAQIVEIATLASCANSLVRLVLALGVPFET